MNPQLTTFEELVLARELHELGVRLDQENFERMEAECRGLSICQIGTPIENGAFTLTSGGTGYSFCVSVSNDSVRNLSLCEIRLESLTWEPAAALLKDPWRKTPREHTYQFPDQWMCGFERDAVLNHMIRRQHVLTPGAKLEGLLLFAGLTPLPTQYRDRDRLDTVLAVIDQKGRCYRELFSLLVQRPEPKKRKLKSRLNLKRDTVAAPAEELAAS